MEQLRSKGMRITSPRVQVVKVLADADQALSPYEIHSRVLAAGGRLDVVSVYRILEAFLELGLVHHVGAVDGYMACSVKDHGLHSQHIICDRCHRVVEVGAPADAVAEALAQASPAGFAQGAVRIEVLAQSCARCEGQELAGAAPGGPG